MMLVNGFLLLAGDGRGKGTVIADGVQATLSDQRLNATLSDERLSAVLSDQRLDAVICDAVPLPIPVVYEFSMVVGVSGVINWGFTSSGGAWGSPGAFHGEEVAFLTAQNVTPRMRMAFDTLIQPSPPFNFVNVAIEGSPQGFYLLEWNGSTLFQYQGSPLTPVADLVDYFIEQEGNALGVNLTGLV